MPLGVLVAATAGWIGYMIQQSIDNALRKAQSSRRVATIITQVLVNGTDEATLREDVEAISDDELTALALAADPDAPLSPDAVNLWELESPDAPLLPDWYMPAPMTGRRRLTRWQRRVAWLIVVAFVLIDAYGLCSTYGSIVWA